MVENCSGGGCFTSWDIYRGSLMGFSTFLKLLTRPTVLPLGFGLDVIVSLTGGFAAFRDY